MTKSDDFSWDDGRIKKENTLGKIVSIPVQEDSEKEDPSAILYWIEETGVIIDDFKEKVTETLSRELHKKE